MKRGSITKSGLLVDSILINGVEYIVISETKIAIHPDPLPAKKGEKVKYPKQRFYTAVKAGEQK